MELTKDGMAGRRLEIFCRRRRKGGVDLFGGKIF